MVNPSSTMLQGSTASTIVEGHVPDTSLAVAAATTTSVVPGITSIEPPITSLTLGRDINDNVSHEDVPEDVNSEEAATLGGYTKVLPIVTARSGIGVDAQSIIILDVMARGMTGVADELQVPAVLMVSKDEAFDEMPWENTHVAPIPVVCTPKLVPALVWSLPLLLKHFITIQQEDQVTSKCSLKC